MYEKRQRQSGFDLIVGLQGAGMTNTLYRTRGSAVLVLHPLTDHDNADIWDPLLLPRGPMLAWFNKHASNSVVNFLASCIILTDMSKL